MNDNIGVNRRLLACDYAVRGLRSFVTVASCVALCVGVGACGNPQNTPTPTSDVVDSPYNYELPGAGQKKAESLNAYIDQILSYPETSDKAREILERAKANGGVSVSDYEQSWMDYKQCMIDRGYQGIVLIKYPNGMYAEPAHRKGTDAQELKLNEDMLACMTDLDPVDLVFGMQQGNPSLYANVSEAIVDCFRRNDLVPKDFTARQYSLEQQENPEDRSYDVYDMEIRACEVANNVFSTYIGDEIAELY
ncbi:hypothetical protein [Bifidobacterium oedipodis]|uniref:Uncharacterized protein n=1 Tax=Bifidobacterium oedipodis TaxID=2675322 RepID=A0A7Y0HS42_9BIFI|nr:hypothetical protein [Bifidobacterium sp. DSM 109957]NMM93601.1 hypothetical protein [Bifidobacterium sp. DSM 109957]